MRMKVIKETVKIQKASNEQIPGYIKGLKNN